MGVVGVPCNDELLDLAEPRASWLRCRSPLTLTPKFLKFILRVVCMLVRRQVASVFGCENRAIFINIKNY